MVVISIYVQIMTSKSNSVHFRITNDIESQHTTTYKNQAVSETMRMLWKLSD